MDKIIPLRVDEAMVEQIDLLVSDGTFRSRNDGIRAGIREILKNFKYNKTGKRKAIARMVANHIMMVYQGVIGIVYMFGSVARGSDMPESDIDILAVSRHPLSYDQELAVISYAGRLLHGIDEHVSIQFESRDDFMAGIERGFEFESTVFHRGILLAGVLKKE
nr:nucleotidyltransferase domain-containing protein [Candidatus Sigynarchaeota archaeon]